MSVLFTLYSHLWLKLFINAISSPWKTLTLLPHDFPDIFHISVKTTSTKQPFVTLTQLRSPCYVDIGHSVLFPLDMCPNCGATFNFEIYLISVFLLKFMSYFTKSTCVLFTTVHFCIQQDFVRCLFSETLLFMQNKISMNFLCSQHMVN